ncbi:LuxR C-terminal-related transcriptional regulator [uncultured Dokdonia sp.]|uniref:LuxR C-terminal-related transcriptional regulator n=1 Tax=uncultured Dokdonia sp. TaxID=575653 RepID=UPI002608C66B|nr:LuxR C-terminal-related transcriptional regulator [uncultured Dokdonia sp.]
MAYFNFNHILLKETVILLTVFLFFSDCFSENSNAVAYYVEHTSEVIFQQITELKTENQSAVILIEKAKEYDEALNYRESNELLLRAIEILKEENNRLDLGYCYYQIGRNYESLSDEKKALEYYLKAESVYQKTDEITRTKVLNLTNLATLYTVRSRFTESLEYLNLAQDLANSLEDKMPLAQVYSCTAEIYMRQEQYEKGITYLQDVGKILDDIGDVDGIIANKLNIMSSHARFGKYDLVALMLDELPDPDTLEKLDQTFFVNYYSSELYIHKKDYKTALKYNNNIISSLEGLDVEVVPYKVSADDQRARIYSSLGDTQVAIDILESTIKDIDDYERIGYKGDILLLLSNLYKDVEKYKRSNEVLNEYIQVKDSVLSIENSTNTEFLKTIFDVEKNKTELEKKETELQYLSEKNKTKNVYNTILIIGIVLLITLAIIAFIKQHRLHASEKRIQDIEQDKLKQNLEFNKRQITNFSIHIKEKNVLLENIKKKISEVYKKEPKLKSLLSNIHTYINDDIKYNKTKIELYSKIQESNNEFLKNLNKTYPDLSPKEMEIIQMLRLNLSSKQIAAQLNLSVYSVDTYRSKIRSKMEVPKNKKLSDHIKEI